MAIVNDDVNDYIKGDIRALVIVNDEGVCDDHKRPSPQNRPHPRNRPFPPFSRLKDANEITSFSFFGVQNNAIVKKVVRFFRARFFLFDKRRRLLEPATKK